MWLVIILLLLLFILYSSNNQIKNKYNPEIYSQAQILKKKSIPNGALLKSPYSRQYDFLTYMGYFLNYKKHEWIFVAFVKDNVVRKFWVNKGVDGNNVTLDLDFYEIADICKVNGFNSLLIGHNHPSVALSPSKQDRIFLKDFLEFFGHYNISVEHVVFVAGRWNKYGLSFMQKINQFLIFPHKN